MKLSYRNVNTAKLLKLGVEFVNSLMISYANVGENNKRIFNTVSKPVYQSLIHVNQELCCLIHVCK